jgi:uncharacterized damage-inducible protein DinB
MEMDNLELGATLEYINKIHGRTMRVVRCMPAEQVDWSYREGKFTLGDLARHIATVNRYMFAETLQGGPSRYAGCGRELAPTHNEIVSLMETLHEETVGIIGAVPDLNAKRVTPDGAAISIRKWLRAMVEHEVHHRGQIYIYLAILNVPTPPLYGLTSEQLLERSARS